MTRRDDTAARARVDAARKSDGSPPSDAGPDDVASLVPPRCDEPSVSVLTACHDDGRYLLDALASLRLCADERIEVIVADDASTDPITREILQQVRDAGVTVVAAQGRGPSAARNAALTCAKAPAILPLDADNLLRPGFVPAALAALDADPAVAVVHADAMRFGRDVGRWIAPRPSVPDLLCGNQLDTCAVVRRAAIEAVGGWDPEVVGSEDWGLWVALLDAGFGFTTLPILGWDYRVRAQSLRSTLTPSVVRSHLVRLVERHPRIYAEHIGAVVANLSGAMGERDELLDAAMQEQRRLCDRVASLESDLAEKQRFATTARRAGAEATQAAREATARAAMAERQRVDAEDRATAAEQHVAAFQQTKLVQWTAGPRSVYQTVRRLFGRR
jgi:hypothetical protein